MSCTNSKPPKPPSEPPINPIPDLRDLMNKEGLGFYNDVLESDLGSYYVMLNGNLDLSELSDSINSHFKSKQKYIKKAYERDLKEHKKKMEEYNSRFDVQISKSLQNLGKVGIDSLVKGIEGPSNLVSSVTSLGTNVTDSVSGAVKTASKISSSLDKVGWVVIPVGLGLLLYSILKD